MNKLFRSYQIEGLLKFFKKGTDSMTEDDLSRTNNCLQIARDILETDINKVTGVHPIFNYIDALLGNVRKELAIQIGTPHEEMFKLSAEIDQGLGHLLKKSPNGNTESFYTCVDIKKEDQFWTSFSDVPSLSYPWNRDRFINAISRIGKNVDNPFKMDIRNHHAKSFFPLGITVITNGNHSAFSGIIKHEGAVKVEEVDDLSNYYQTVLFDGSKYIEKNAGEILFKPQYKELGIIYNIGRLILKHDSHAKILRTVYPDHILNQIESNINELHHRY